MPERCTVTMETCTRRASRIFRMTSVRTWLGSGLGFGLRAGVAPGFGGQRGVEGVRTEPESRSGSG